MRAYETTVPEVHISWEELSYEKIPHIFGALNGIFRKVLPHKTQLPLDGST